MHRSQSLALPKRPIGAVLIKAVVTFTVVCIALGVLFDLLNGTFDVTSFAAETLWIAGLFAPLLIGGMAAVVVADKLARERWTGPRRALRIVLIVVSFASTAVVTTVAARFLVSHAPESIAARYQWLEDRIAVMTRQDAAE
jgi:amino acid transporter